MEALRETEYSTRVSLQDLLPNKLKTPTETGVLNMALWETQGPNHLWAWSAKLSINHVLPASELVILPPPFYTLHRVRLHTSFTLPHTSASTQITQMSLLPGGFLPSPCAYLHHSSQHFAAASSLWGLPLHHTISSLKAGTTHSSFYFEHLGQCWALCSSMIKLRIKLSSGCWVRGSLSKSKGKGYWDVSGNLSNRKEKGWVCVWWMSGRGGGIVIQERGRQVR